MAIAYYNSASTPVNQNDSNSASPTVVTPPGSMTSGDLVVVCCFNRLSADTHAISAAGGQSWTQLTTESSQALVSSTWFWCIFDGTWTASPSWSHGGTNNTCMMIVFRPTAGKSWAVDVAEVPAGFAAPGDSLVTIPEINTTANSVAIASWASRDDNDWALVAGAEWTEALSISNLAGQDSGVMMAYKLMPSGGVTGSPVGNQVAVGGDIGSQNIASFKEVTAGVTLVMDDAFHGLTSDVPTLTQKHTLVSIDAFHGLISDEPVLTQKHILIVVDTAHGQTADGDLTLTQKSTLVVNDTAHALTSDNTILTQLHNLAIQDAFHGLISDNVNLTQKHDLVVSDTVHSHTADGNLILVESGGSTVLVIQDAFHGMISDNIAITQKQVLVVQDAVYGGGGGIKFKRWTGSEWTPVA